MGSLLVPAMPVTAAQAEASVQAFLKQQRQQRRLPQLPPSLAKFAKDTEVHVFNVGPWEHWVPLGSWGMFYVPKCEDGQPYAKMAAVPGIFCEPIPVDERNFQLEQIEGRYVAEQVLGIGKGLAWQQSRAKLGVFIGERVGKAGEKPAAEELDAARKVLDETFHELFEEAQAAAAVGRTEEIKIVSEKHRIAARALGRTDVPWLSYSPEGKRKSCPNCGTKVESTIISCPECTYVFDVAAFKREIQGRMASAITKQG